MSTLPVRCGDINGKSEVMIEVCPCMFCGDRKATGHWEHDGGYLGICHVCAEEDLPCLIADAIVGLSRAAKSNPSVTQVCRSVAAVTNRLWYAVALALARLPHEICEDIRAKEEEIKAEGAK